MDAERVMQEPAIVSNLDMARTALSAKEAQTYDRVVRGILTNVDVVTSDASLQRTMELQYASGVTFAVAQTMVELRGVKA